MKKANTSKFGFIILMFSALIFFSFQTDKSRILWREDTPLTWEDFMGKPEKRFAVASTHYDILKSIIKEADNSAVVKIEAVFLRNESWKKISWVSDEVLDHEQKHFDIVELYARKLRKRIKESSFKNLKYLESKVQELYDEIDKEMDLYQDKYDDETESSMNGSQQRAWHKKINGQLKEFDEYKETVVKVKF